MNLKNEDFPGSTAISTIDRATKNPNCFWKMSFFPDKRRIEGNIGNLSRTVVFCACRKTGRFWVYYYYMHLASTGAIEQLKTRFGTPLPFW